MRTYALGQRTNFQRPPRERAVPAIWLIGGDDKLYIPEPEPPLPVPVLMRAVEHDGDPYVERELIGTKP